jgi:arsenite methyltransferase
MSSALQFDDIASRRVEATYMTPDVVQQRSVVRAALDLQPDEDVLDIGSGPGLLAYEMATDVAPDGSVCGIDASDSMLAIARARKTAARTAPITFAAGDACTLRFADDSFDAAVATQVYEYVEDIPAALGEARRVLRPGGRLLVLDTDWDSIVWHSGDLLRMRRVMDAWGEHLVDPHLPRRLIRLLDDAGLTVDVCQIVPILNVRSNNNTYSQGMADLIADFVPGRQELTEADVLAWRDDLNDLSHSGNYFFNLNRYLFRATKR